MAQEEILEGNKLIAEFMELKQVNWYSPMSNTYTVLWVNKNFKEDFTYVGDYSETSLFDWKNSLPQSEKLFYNYSWNWLMPVVEKIEDTEELNDGYGYRCIIDNASCIIKDAIIGTIISSYACPYAKSKIEATWLAVVEFIKWYNLCQKEK